MPRSPSRPKSKTARIALSASVVTLRDPLEYRRRLMDVDFSGARERVIGAVLAARVSASNTALGEMTLADRHWLIAQLMLREGPGVVEVAVVCSQCGELLELRLDLEAAVRDAEPATRRKLSGVRLPTVRDLEQARDLEELIAACAGDRDISEIDQILSDADPLGSIALNAECCQCSHEVRVEIDLPARWLAAQRRIGCDLLDEVHTLARHYHWSEREILELSESRRQFYIALCRAEHDANWLEQQTYV